MDMNLFSFVMAILMFGGFAIAATFKLRKYGEYGSNKLKCIGDAVFYWILSIGCAILSGAFYLAFVLEKLGQ